MDITDRLQRIVERTNALQPVQVSVESILVKMEADLDMREGVRAKRAATEARIQAQHAAEREAQKPFSVGDLVAWQTYHTSHRDERIATPHQGEIVGVEDTNYYGPLLVVKATNYLSVSKVRVLENDVKALALGQENH